MIYIQRSVAIFFSIIVIILLGIVGYLYLNNKNSMGENVNFSLVDASIKITTNLGGCPASFPCYETYKLVYMFGTNGTVFHNGDLQGNLSKAQTIELMKKTLGLYQNNICTPLFTSGTTQNYELTIDQKLYKFGNDKGCMEMQEVLNTIKTTIGV